MKRQEKANKMASKKKKGANARILAAAVMITAACGGLFFGISDNVLAAELGKVEGLPTAYEKPLQINEVKAKDLSENPTSSANYQIIEESNYYENNKVSGNELSKEEAAQIGTAFVSQLYHVDMNDTYVYMGYMTGTKTFPRAFWSGDICFTDEERKPDDTRYSFMLDAVTGEIFTVSAGRKLDVTVSLDYDPALAKDNSEYGNIAMQFVKDKGLLSTEPVKAEYSGQGYENNDPSIMFIVYGTDGERVNLSFSRYDKSFKGLITQADMNISQKALEELNP